MAKYDPAPGADGSGPPESAESIMRNHDFVRIWAGETVSLIGTQVTAFALPLVAILTLHASVLQVGVLNMLRNVPIVVFSLLAGVWLDRRRRRPIMIVCSLGNAVLIGLVPVSSWLGWLSLGLLYVVTFLGGILSVVFDVGVLTYMPSLVGREQLHAANSRMQTSMSLSLVAGPSLAGLLIGILTAPVTLAADSISYFCSAIGLIGVRRPEPPPELPEVRMPVRKSIAEGLRSVYGNPILRSLLGLSGTFNFVQAGFITVFVVYAVRDMGLSPLKLGIVVGAGSIGGIIGAAFAIRISKNLGLGPTMLFCLGGATLFPSVLLIPHGAGLYSVLIMSFSFFCYGIGVLIYNVNTVTLRQVVTPDRLLGRMNASYRLVLFGTAPPGAFIAGVLGQSLGLHMALVIAVIAFPATILWTVSSPVIRLKEMPTGPLEETAGEPQAPTRDAIKDGQNS